MAKKSKSKAKSKKKAAKTRKRAAPVRKTKAKRAAARRSVRRVKPKPNPKRKSAPRRKARSAMATRATISAMTGPGPEVTPIMQRATAFPSSVPGDAAPPPDGKADD